MIVWVTVSVTPWMALLTVLWAALCADDWSDPASPLSVFWKFPNSISVYLPMMQSYVKPMTFVRMCTPSRSSMTSTVSPMSVTRSMSAFSV